MAESTSKNTKKPKTKKAAVVPAADAAVASASPINDDKGSRASSSSQGSDVIDTIVQTFKMASASWDAFVFNLPVFIILWALPVLLALIAVPFVILPLAANHTIGLFVSLVFLALIVLIALIFVPASVVAQLDSVDNKRLTFELLYQKSRKIFLPFIGLEIIMAIVITIGFLLLIVPGIIALFFLMFAPYVMVDQRKGVFDSMQTSIDLVKANWPWALGLACVGAAISILSSITFIGAIASIVLGIVYLCLPALVYRKITR